MDKVASAMSPNHPKFAKSHVLISATRSGVEGSGGNGFGAATGFRV